MKAQKFSKAPVTLEDKEKLATKFMEASDSTQKTAVKQKAKPLYLRVPESFLNNIKEICNITGLSQNAICLDILRPAIKKRLQELKDE
ncbi:MAG TPA: hypothetical protein PLW01_11025 [Agitococcus sp.]|nr:hypothetical protein [Agitococcus sp.]